MKKIALTMAFIGTASLLCAGEVLFKSTNLKEFGRTTSLSEKTPGIIYAKRITSANCITKFDVTPEKAYRISCEARLSSDVQAAQQLRIGVNAFAENGQPAHISGIMPNAGTETELVAPVAKKDKVIKVKDCSKWNSKASRVVFNADPSGQMKDIPNFNFIGGSIVSVKQEGDIYLVTLSKVAGQDIPAGTKIRQHADSRPAIFSAPQKMSTEWKKYEFIIGPGMITKNNASNKLYSGVKKVSPMCYMPAKSEMRNLTLEVVE